MNRSTEQKMHYTLRIAAAMCFIGHGAFGIITKPIWCNYFGVFGIGQHMSYQLMPVVGVIDIFCGAVMLIYPLRAVPLWLVLWGAVTASLRPLSGEPFAEFIERAGNFGAPLALLFLSGGLRVRLKNIFSPIDTNRPVNNKMWQHCLICLQIIVFLLLAGHGWLNLLEKKSLLEQYRAIGFSNPPHTAITIGIAEIIAAFAVLVKPLRSLLFLLIFWKIFSEFFYPHHEVFEWIERGGSYGCIIALWLATGENSFSSCWDKITPKNNPMRNTAQS
jgi:hypothetical protein